jgi:biotin operon repressor
MNQGDAILAHASSWGRVYVWWIRALRKSGAGVTARDVLALLASYADKKTGRAWPSLETIAATLGIGKRSTLRAIGELKAAGILLSIPRNRRAGEANLYRLAVHGLPFQVNESDTYSDPIR